ncbi:centromere protein R isoform X6 [Pogona vitticeps]
MPAKRALKLDSFIMGKVPATPQVSSKKNHQSYSPTTGTCLMSPFSSPRSNNIQEQRNGLSKGKRDVPKGLAMKSSRKGQPQIEESDRLSVLQSKVEDSLETFMQIRQNLTSLQNIAMFSTALSSSKLLWAKVIMIYDRNGQSLNA